MEQRTYQHRDLTLLPQSDRHGRGFAGRSYTTEEMDETAGYIGEARATGTSPAGYGKRFFDDTPGFRKTSRGFLLPEGYDTAVHPNRKNLSPELEKLVEHNWLTSPPDVYGPWQVREELQNFYHLMGWETDQNGRACNPHLEQLIHDKRIGLNTNLGAGYTGGENIVVDVVVTDGTRTLITTRVDLGSKVLPSLVGGYTWPEDYEVTNSQWRDIPKRPISRRGIFRAAQRIVLAKTGVQLPGTNEAEYDIMWGIYPTSSVHTAHFWSVVFTVLVRVENGMAAHLTPAPNRPDAHWADETEIVEILPLLWPDHRRGLIACRRG